MGERPFRSEKKPGKEWDPINEVDPTPVRSRTVSQQSQVCRKHPLLRTQPLSSLTPMAETSYAMAEFTDGLIIWFPANNRNFSRSESLVHLFLGRATCLSHHFRDLANQELPRPYQPSALTGRERLRLAQLSQ